MTTEPDLTPYCEAKGCNTLPARAHLESHAHWGCTSPEQMTELIDAVLAEARAVHFREAAARLDRIGDTVEARVTERFGAEMAAGSADMIRDCAELLRTEAAITAATTPTTAPEERP